MFVCAIDLINEKDVFIINACQLDEVVHRFFGDDERGILAIRLLIEVVVVEGDDGWTVCLKDGSLGAHFEHTVLVTEDGYEILTQA